jgi:hypothetical protein
MDFEKSFEIRFRGIQRIRRTVLGMDEPGVIDFVGVEYPIVIRIGIRRLGPMYWL